MCWCCVCHFWATCVVLFAAHQITYCLRRFVIGARQTTMIHRIGAESCSFWSTKTPCRPWIAAQESSDVHHVHVRIVYFLLLWVESFRFLVDCMFRTIPCFEKCSCTNSFFSRFACSSASKKHVLALLQICLVTCSKNSFVIACGVFLVGIIVHCRQAFPFWILSSICFLFFDVRVNCLCETCWIDVILWPNYELNAFIFTTESWLPISKQFIFFLGQLLQTPLSISLFKLRWIFLSTS